MADALHLETTLPAPPDKVFAAWLDGALHGEMTGGPASSDPRVGGAFTAWEGYITGTWLALEPGRRLVFSWRTSEFPEHAADSRVEISLAADAAGGTRLRLDHTAIPAGQGPRYEGGWQEFYFQPMARFFGSL